MSERPQNPFPAADFLSAALQQFAGRNSFSQLNSVTFDGRYQDRLLEGILPALESSNAIAKAVELARTLPKDEHVVVCLSGRGDKDASEINRLKDERAK